MLKFLGNTKVHISVTLLFVALFPWLVNLLTITWPFKSAGHDDAWISFWGSYFGGILTITGVLITLRANRKLQEKALSDDRLMRDRATLELAIGTIQGLQDFAKYGGFFMNTTSSDQATLVNHSVISSGNRIKYIYSLEMLERSIFTSEIRQKIHELLAASRKAKTEFEAFEAAFIADPNGNNPLEQFARLQRLQGIANQTCSSITEISERIHR
jgi:hypothetical protein